MSMISAQCDELRKAAQTCRTLGGYEMEQTLLQAADTITELRGALQVASVDYRHLSEENAELRELLSESLMDYKLYAEKYGLPPYISDVNEHLDARMRELGIEVE